MAPLSRRAVLGAAAAVGLTGVGAYGLGRSHGESTTAAPTTLPGVRIVSGILRSRHVPDRDLGWKMALPSEPGGLVVALHGSPGRGANWVDKHGAAGAALTSGLAIVGVDGDDSWWHARREGVDAGTDYQEMVVADLLPAMAARGLPTTRIGLLGLSMGGYGALLLAERLGPSRCFAVATMSAAIYLDIADEEDGAFDDQADFDANNVLTQADRLTGIPVWLAVGTSDDFIEGNRELAKRVPWATTVFDEGKHNNAYWTGHIGAAAEFLAGHV